MKKCIVFIVHGISGGTATLSLRVGKKLLDNGYDVYYLKHSSNSAINENLFAKSGICVITDDYKNWISKLVEISKSYSNCILMTYSFELLQYVIPVVKKCKKSGTNVSYYLYAVISECMVRGNSIRTKHPVISRALNILDIPLIKKIYEQKRLIIHDENCVKTTEDALGIKLVEIEKQLIRVPYEIDDERAKARPEKNENEFIITTMARIDFPFKEYIIGLVDDVVCLSDKYPIILNIIGNGKDYQKLENKVKKCNQHGNIILHGEMEYSKAIQLIQSSNLFVGMGTGILDSASVHVPSIPVQRDTNLCLGKGYFSEDPRYFGYEKGQTGLSDISSKIVSIINMDDKEYMELCNREFDALKDNYSMEKLLNFINNNGHSEEPNCWEWMLYKLNIKILTVYSRIVGDRNE